ncbi:MAG TPA: NADH-dependent alcohol dehydrogenase [Chlorobium sp.]|uniref:Iron-containing alcohol dehydrogenase n=1 Tax=Chlorobium phaeovibrioides (strain DSM 265 / 1930) TaxID=290318 RepID=A4SER0_CHLPM|nr:NADH-dependent alcohol dehydrogenase [Chlorobium sp.]
MHFEYQNPTRIVFGKGTLSKLGEVVREYGKKALVVTGGGSVKRNGTFERAVRSLNEAGVAVAQCAGVEPNPRIATVERGADTARREGCDVVVALGGGSVMDAAKVMAAAVFYEGDPWNMMAHGQPDRRLPESALPLITVPTLAATGSEMNSGAVITDEKSTLKSVVSARCLYPKVAVVDPELTLSVPKDQTANGICDLITHVTESYFNGIDGTPVQDRFAEGVILTAMEWGPEAIADGSNIQAREQVQWASLVALNGWVQAGTASPFPVHMIEHSLSAHHDIAHGAGLSAINPSWMRFAARTRPDRFAGFAHRIFSIPLNGPEDSSAAMEGINRFEAFLASIGCPTSLGEMKIGDALIEQYAQDTLQVIHDAEGRLPGRPPMSAEDIVEVLRKAL